RAIRDIRRRLMNTNHVRGAIVDDHWNGNGVARPFRRKRVRDGMLAAAIPLTTLAILLIGGCDPGGPTHVPANSTNTPPPVGVQGPDSSTSSPDGAPAPTPPPAGAGRGG
ncbi:MAG: hypothetical protein AB8G96_12120, partial [Phycisphaerales bacterium]